MDDHIRITSKSLLRTASLLALCGILLGILVGAYAYSRGRNASLDVIRESDLNLARSFSLHAESLDPTLTKPQILQQLAHNWSATESRYDGRYLCVIDRTALFCCTALRRMKAAVHQAAIICSRMLPEIPQQSRNSSTAAGTGPASGRPRRIHSGPGLSSTARTSVSSSASTRREMKSPAM